MAAMANSTGDGHNLYIDTSPQICISQRLLSAFRSVCAPCQSMRGLLHCVHNSLSGRLRSPVATHFRIFNPDAKKQTQPDIELQNNDREYQRSTSVIN